MRPALPVLVSIAIQAVALPSAGAQGPSAVASTSVTVIVPERGASLGSPEDREERRGALSRPRLRAVVTGRDDRAACRRTLDLGPIGRASVSCLETVELADVPAGVAIELAVNRDRTGEAGAAPVLELLLDDRAAIRLPMQPYVRDGVEVLRSTMPARAFARVAGARRISVRWSDASQALGEQEVDAMRGIAESLGVVPIHDERARR